METLKINVFKVTLPHEGNVVFDIMSNHTRTSGCFSVEHVAQCTKTCIKSFMEYSKEEVSVEIDLVPIHDIEKGPNQNFKLCSKLSGREKKDFWKHFIKE